jgi:hypothetical protein
LSSKVLFKLGSGSGTGSGLSKNAGSGSGSVKNQSGSTTLVISLFYLFTVQQLDVYNTSIHQIILICIIVSLHFELMENFINFTIIFKQ